MRWTYHTFTHAMQSLVSVQPGQTKGMKWTLSPPSLGVTEARCHRNPPGKNKGSTTALKIQQWNHSYRPPPCVCVCQGDSKGETDIWAGWGGEGGCVCACVLSVWRVSCFREHHRFLFDQKKTHTVYLHETTQFWRLILKYARKCAFFFLPLCLQRVSFKVVTKHVIRVEIKL